MFERNASLPPDRRIEFRVGIHLRDDVEESDGDLMGDGANIAARLEGVAKPGGICLSEDRHATRSHLRPGGQPRLEQLRGLCKSRYDFGLCGRAGGSRRRNRASTSALSHACAGFRLSSSTTRANCERAIDEMKAVGAIWPAAVTPHEHLAAAYANLSKLDLARSEAGLIPERAMPNPSLALARLWYEPYYKRVEDLNRHGSLGRRCRRALPKAGIGISLHDHDRWVDSSSDS
jgi:hypothetical protein